jgi:hypothetical protein
MRGGCEVADQRRAADAWIAAMRAGDFDRAWAISDQSLADLHRFAVPKHEGPRHLQRIWRGEQLSGRKVLVRCYHGLGDTIQSIRFARPLREIAREVVVWCQPELVPLISGVAGVDRAVPLHDGAPNLEFDVDIEIMEIPHAIRARRDQIAMQSPYLICSPRPIPMRQAQKLSVGLFWQTSDWDVRRALPMSELRKLARPDVQLFSVQRGAGRESAGQIGAIDVSSSDLQTLAGRLRALDLVICPDSMVAHLSASLGCETWIILPTDCDWRWPTAGSSSFWYPTARLFHQHPKTGWAGVFEDVRGAIAAYLAQRQSPQNWAGASTSAPIIDRENGRGEKSAVWRKCR